MDGRPLAERAEWQSFTRDHSLALVSCYFVSKNLALPTYCQADRGSGQALLRALAVLGKASGHPEFEHVPILLLGFSAGGQFSYSFACFCPSRVAAFVANKGGIYATPATDEARQTPGLFIAGAKDTAARRAAIQDIFMDNRRLGARWCMAIEPNTGHKAAGANQLALPFFAAVMRSWDRPPAARAGIVLDLDHHRMIAPGVPPKEAMTTFWFPDEQTLAAWNSFMADSK